MRASSRIPSLAALMTMGAVLCAVVGQAAAQEYCLGTASNSRFYLHTIESTVTSVGTVVSVAGIHRFTGGGDLRNPVTGTIFIEPPPGPTRYRVDLLETGSPGTQSLIWNARLSVVV
jgi:hypothetical protein